MQAPYPNINDFTVDAHISEDIDWLQKVISGLRQVRSESGISPARAIPLLCSTTKPKDQQLWLQYSSYITALAKLTSVEWLNNNDNLPACATAIVEQLEMHIPLAEVIDKKQELARLDKELQKLDKELQKCRQKLDNPNYINKAPAPVVAQEQERLKATENTITKLRAHYERIVAL